MKIGFIGTGVMGSSMARHLMKAGYEVNVYNRTKSKTDSLVEEGAVWQETPRNIAEQSDIIFTIVGYPADVEQIYFGDDGIVEGITEGKIVIDMTTSTPALAQKITEKFAEKGVMALDAPVSGGDLGAKNGTLTVMVGGDKATFEKVLPVIQTFGKEVRWFGGAGSGQHTKMANQIMVAGTMTGLTEMLAYAKAAGLQLEDVLKTVSGGAAANWSLEKYGPRIITDDYSPGFFVKHFVKDLGIALEEASKLDVKLPATDQAYQLYKQLEEQGHGDEGTQSLIKLWWGE
ncbi:NAD(P)-dependent oxidoreductase [Aerococcaceae bacterium WGS1372]